MYNVQPKKLNKSDDLTEQASYGQAHIHAKSETPGESSFADPTFIVL
jgi:hypothetical protein